MLDLLGSGLASNREGFIGADILIVSIPHFPLSTPPPRTPITSPSQPASFFYNLVICSYTHCVQLVLPTRTWAWTHSLGHGQPSIGHTSKEKWFLLLQHVATANSSWDRGRTLRFPPFSRLLLTGLILSTFCRRNHCCCELRDVTTVSCPEDSISQYPPHPGSYILSTPLFCDAIMLLLKHTPYFIIIYTAYLELALILLPLPSKPWNYCQALLLLTFYLETESSLIAQTALSDCSV